MTYTGGNGQETTYTHTDSFDLVIKDPCVDPTYVWITGPTLSALQYTIGAPAATYSAHDTFSINFANSSADPTICGEIAYEGQFESVAVDGDPLSYTAATRVFEAESRDMDLLNDPTPRKYQVVASLANYSSS